MNNTVKIQELKDRYKSSFFEKAEQINQFLALLSDEKGLQQEHDTMVDEVCVETHEFLHKLAGSSGMYDYEDIALLSRKAMSSSRNAETESLVVQLGELYHLLNLHAQGVDT